jgi:hypothetical protein
MEGDLESRLIIIVSNLRILRVTNFYDIYGFLSSKTIVKLLLLDYNELQFIRFRLKRIRRDLLIDFIQYWIQFNFFFKHERFNGFLSAKALSHLREKKRRPGGNNDCPSRLTGLTSIRHRTDELERRFVFNDRRQEKGGFFQCLSE